MNGFVLQARLKLFICNVYFTFAKKNSPQVFLFVGCGDELGGFPMLSPAPPAGLTGGSEKLP